MPLMRYFMFMGAILLGLLFWTDWYFPKPAAAVTADDVDRSVIRIHSSHRWPSAVRFDTSAPMPRVAAATVAEAEPETPAAMPEKSVKQAYAYAPPPSPKTVERPHRRKAVSRPPARDTRRWYASTQPNWFSW